MKKSYSTPSLELRKYRLPYNSVFTDSGDREDDDIYDITLGNSGGDYNNNDIFGD
ncbi:MAG: hypothetical protein K6C14_02935 [Eubacterium sp.]|nr:hypothetical protein [Eubacterium sp.]